MMMKKILFLSLWLMIPSTSFAENQLQIIPLSHRLASEIQPLAKPFLLHSEIMVSNGSSLILKASPERLEEIQDLIRQLDTPLQNLRISVIRAHHLSAQQLNAHINPHSLGIQANTGIAETYHQQHLRTLDNQPAIIQIGKTLPSQRYYRDKDGRINLSTPLISATTGFEVTPRLSGEEVILTIAPWSNQIKNRHSINTQSLKTTLRARLGQWVEIGGQNSHQYSQQTAIISKHHQNQQQSFSILLKVDKDL